MSGGSAFYVLIYAVFYFVNKVFLLGGSATFLGVTVGFGKGNSGPAESQCARASPRQCSQPFQTGGGGCRCPRTCAEQHSLTPPQRGSPFSWTKMKVFLPLPALSLQRALVGLSSVCVISLTFFILFCFSWILLSSFPPYCTLATLPSWSCPSGS